MQGKKVVVTGVVLAAVGGITLWVSGMFGTDTAVLDVANPTDEQIRQIAELVFNDEGNTRRRDDIRRRATQRLYELEDRSVPALTALTPRGFRYVGVALPMIIDLDLDAAFEVADGLLGHADPVIRSTALQLFQRLADDERTIALWVKGLEDRDSGVREDLCRRLADDTPRRFRDAAIAGLLRLKSDPSEEVRGEAAVAMHALTGRSYDRQFGVQ